MIDSKCQERLVIPYHIHATHVFNSPTAPGLFSVTVVINQLHLLRAKKRISSWRRPGGHPLCLLHVSSARPESCLRRCYSTFISIKAAIKSTLYLCITFPEVTATSGLKGPGFNSPMPPVWPFGRATSKMGRDNSAKNNGEM